MPYANAIYSTFTAVMIQKVVYPSGATDHVWAGVSSLAQHCSADNTILLTEANVAAAHPVLFEGYRTIIIPAGEQSKTMAVAEFIITELVKLQATRNTTLVGIGGGVITDIAGFVAATYMRGIRCGFVPTTVLAMADAAIGGKNGVNIGLHKNIAGTVRQPAFILFDTNILATLPTDEWSNGFAEVIKYACIFDEPMLDELERNNLAYYMQNNTAMEDMIHRCTNWKNEVVIADEHEKGGRKLLNFGHTAAHAIENLYNLPHGKAVAIGMVVAARLSEAVTGLSHIFTQRLQNILKQYHLPFSYPYDATKAMELLVMDKKRSNDKIDYILLDKPGHGIIQPLSLDIIEQTLIACAQ